jgi:hypothetical protein
MSSKKKTTANPNMQTLRFGTRVRCTDDGVEGRITWANAVSVKIKWNDGEEVTWKRDALASRPIQILDADDLPAEEPPAATEPTAATAQPQVEVTTPPAEVEQADATATPVAELAPPTQEQTEIAIEVPATEAPAQGTLTEPVGDGTEPAPEKSKRQRKAPAEPKEKKVSALDAAARVLAEENRPMTCQEMIDTMAAKGYWVSPGGATPAATVYSAILREMTTKGAAARFIKTERGKFALRTTV